jgi:hypothetical protein
MFKKSFVSLAFSSQKIEVLELDSTKKKIKIIGSTPLPQGTILNREIKNPTVLTQTIASTWKSLKIMRNQLVYCSRIFNIHKTYQTAKLPYPNLTKQFAGNKRFCLTSS